MLIDANCLQLAYILFELRRTLGMGCTLGITFQVFSSIQIAKRDCPTLLMVVLGSGSVTGCVLLNFFIACISYFFFRQSCKIYKKMWSFACFCGLTMPEAALMWACCLLPSFLHHWLPCISLHFFPAIIPFNTCIGQMPPNEQINRLVWHVHITGYFSNCKGRKLWLFCSNMNAPWRHSVKWNNTSGKTKWLQLPFAGSPQHRHIQGHRPGDCVHKGL